MSGRIHLQSVYLQPGVALLDSGHCRVVNITPLLRAAILRAAKFTSRSGEGGPEAHVAAVLIDEIAEASVAPLNLPLPTDPSTRALALEFLADPSGRRPRHEWSRKFGASERSLERLFHREVGTTFGRWQQQARLLHALRLLTEGQSVTRTSLDVGVDTPSAFIAMFRSAMGTTPGRYFDRA